MGYDLKNARNGKSVSKIPKLKFGVHLWKMMLESKAVLSSNLFHTNLLNFFKIQTIIKSHSLLPGAPRLVILTFSTCFFHFWHS